MLLVGRACLVLGCFLAVFSAADGRLYPTDIAYCVQGSWYFGAIMCKLLKAIAFSEIKGQF